MNKLRARRFPLELPVRYRPVGEKTWLHGTTENMSHSGVLIHAAQPLEIGTAIEVAITLAAATPVAPASDVIGQARVVRAERTYSAARGTTLAAEFEDYRIVPRKDRGN